MKKLIFFLLFISGTASVYAEMPGLDGYMKCTSSATVVKVYNYLQSKSADYTWLKQQRLEYTVNSGTGTPCENEIYFTIRLPLNKIAVRNEIKDKCIWFKNVYGSDIIEGYLKKHKCLNDGIAGTVECEWILLWSK